MADPKKNPCKGHALLDDLTCLVLATADRQAMDSEAVAPALMRLRRHCSEVDHEHYVEVGGGRGPAGPAGDRGKPGRPGADGKQGKQGKPGPVGGRKKN